MKTYHITLQGQDYTICLRSYSVEINGTRYKIRSLPARKLLFLTMEVDLPISGAHVMLVSGLWSMELVVDGVMLRTGKPYTPIGKIPVWAYVVSALNLAQIMNGAVGGVLAVLGIFLTTIFHVVACIPPFHVPLAQLASSATASFHLS